MSHKFSMVMSWLGPGVQCRDTQLVNTWGSKATWCGTRDCLVTAQPCFHHAVCRAGYRAPLEWQHICNWPQTTEPQRELAVTEVPALDKSSWTIRWHLEKKTLYLLHSFKQQNVHSFKNYFAKQSLNNIYSLALKLFCRVVVIIILVNSTLAY